MQREVPGWLKEYLLTGIDESWSIEFGVVVEGNPSPLADERPI